MNTSVQRLCLLILCGGMLSPSVKAANTSQITVKVKVLEALSCVINGNNPIEVNFGDAVMTTRVDGINYQQPVSYTLACSGTKNAIKMQIAGTGAGFDSGALQTNKTDLGIALFNGGTRLPVNSWLNFTYPNKPDLKAAPVKKTGSTLAGGAFSASATMQVAYQ